MTGTKAKAKKIYQIQTTAPIEKAWLAQGASKVDARQIAWEQCDYITRYQKHIFSNPRAIQRLHYLKHLADHGKTVVLVCYEKDPPCHRFLLLEILGDLEEGAESIPIQSTLEREMKS